MEFVAVHIIGPLLKKLKGNQFVLVMKYYSSEMMREVRASETTASHVASILMDI